MSGRKKATPPKHHDTLEAMADKLIAETDQISDNDDDGVDEDPGRSTSVASNISGPVVSYDDLFKAGTANSGSLFDTPPKSPFSFAAFDSTGKTDTDSNEQDEHHQKTEEVTKVKLQHPPLTIPAPHQSSTSREDNKKLVVDDKLKREEVQKEWMEKFRKIGQKNEERVTLIGEEGEIVQVGSSEPFEFVVKPTPKDASATAEKDTNKVFTPMAEKGVSNNDDNGQEYYDEEIIEEYLSVASSGDEITEESVISHEPEMAFVSVGSAMTDAVQSGYPPGEGDVETLEFVAADDGIFEEEIVGVSQHEEEELLDEEDQEESDDSSVEAGPIPESINRMERDDDASGYDPELEYDASTSSEESNEDRNEDANKGKDDVVIVPLEIGSHDNNVENHQQDLGYNDEDPDGMEAGLLAISSVDDLARDGDDGEVIGDKGIPDSDEIVMNEVIHDDGEMMGKEAIPALSAGGDDQSVHDLENLRSVGEDTTGLESTEAANTTTAQQVQSEPTTMSSPDTTPIPSDKKMDYSKYWTPLIILVSMSLLAGVIAGLVLLSLDNDGQSLPSSTVPLPTPPPTTIPTITPFPSPGPSSIPTMTPTETFSPSSSLTIMPSRMLTSAPTDRETQSPTPSVNPTGSETEEPGQPPVPFPEPTFLRTSQPSQRNTSVPSQFPVPTQTTSSPLPSETPAPNPSAASPVLTTPATRSPISTLSPSPLLSPTLLPSTFPASLPSIFPFVSPEAPENNLCINAIGPLPTNFTPTLGTIVNAGVDDVDRCDDVEDVGPGVWYYVFGTGGEMIAHTCLDTNFDSRVTVFGAFCDKPVCIEANDDYCGPDTTLSAVSWMSTYRDIYRILVSGNQDFVDGSFTIVVGARYNDECTTAIGPLFVGNPLPMMGDTLEATPNAVTCNGETNDSPSVWYLVRGTGGSITADLCEEFDFNVRIRILTGSCSELECIAISDTADCSLTWESIPFQDYYVMISGQTADEVGSFSMSLSTTGMQDHDECSDALGPLSLDGSPVFGSTAGTTPDFTAPPCLSAITANGVWYFLEGNGSVLQASLCEAASYDTRISIYSGSCTAGDDLSDLVCVAANDDFCGSQSLVTWESQLGLTYFVLVHGYLESSGNFILSVTTLG